MKLCPTKFATSVAIVVLASTVLRGFFFKFWPEYFLKMVAKCFYIADAAKFSQDFVFSYESMLYRAMHLTVAAFIMTWFAIAIYNLMVKE